MNTTIRRLLIAAMGMLMAVCILPFVTTQAYAGTAGAKTGDEYPYYGEDPTAYTPETITLDNTNPTEWSKILYPGDKLKFTKDEEGSNPRFMGFSSTAELSENYGFTDGTTYITGEVNATGETLYIYDSIVLSSDADYALYIYGNSRGVAGLKDNPDTADVNEGNYWAYGISRIEKIPLYINIWYQLYNGKIPSGATANPTKILNPKETTFLKLNSAPTKDGEVLDYWGNMAEYVKTSTDVPAGAVAFYPVYPPDASEQDYYPDYRYNGPYTNGVTVGLTAQYKPITYTIRLGDISAYEALHGSKGFLQWYDPIMPHTSEYMESCVHWGTDSSWKVVGTDTRSNLDINGTVIAREGTNNERYGLRAQAPTEDYILSGWSITDSAGNELNDTYKLRMTETYAEKVNGIWNYLLCIATNGNYYDVNLVDGETFIVTPVFVEKTGEDISSVNISMTLGEYVGGDVYDILEERATIASADSGKYSITKEQTTIDSGITGYSSGEYIVEPGDTLYYTAEIQAAKSQGYQFADSVDLMVNGSKVATAASEGETVRFQDVIRQTATGGVTQAVFDSVGAGDTSWSIRSTFTGISRSKENLAAEKCTEYGTDTQPCTIVCVEMSVNGGKTSYTYFEPQTSSGTETFTLDSALITDFDHTFSAGDVVQWKCYAYNYLYDYRMGWEPHKVGDTLTGSFTVKLVYPAGQDPNQKGEGGSAIGKGASAVAADNAIRSSASEEGPKGSKYAPLQLRSTKQANNSITLNWVKAKGAKKYVLYGNTCNAKGKKYKMVKIGNITSGKSSYAVKKLPGKKLKKGTYYKFMIVALDSKNNVISTSKVVHAATKGNKKISNPSKVTTKKPMALKKGKKFKLGAKQVGKNVKKHRGLCYETTKPKVATVSSKGVVKAVGKGTCYVYAYAQNGVYKKVKIVVK